jgi:hypothetical protein
MWIQWGNFRNSWIPNFLFMAYSEDLESRTSSLLRAKKIFFEAKKMMGWLCYLIDNKMCMGIVRDKLMCRIDPEIYESCLKHDGCNEMDFTGKPMRGYVFVEPWVLERDEELVYWVELCLAFNPRAKSSKKKKAK